MRILTPPSRPPPQKALAAALEGTPPLDVVVNNAGYFPKGPDDLQQVRVQLLTIRM